jgi:hypothetical protein
MIKLKNLAFTLCKKVFIDHNLITLRVFLLFFKKVKTNIKRARKRGNKTRGTKN